MILPEPIKEFKEFNFTVCRGHGLNTIQSKILAILRIETKPKSLEELALQTKYSLASISTQVKALSDFQIIKKSRKPGSKRVYVEAKTNVIEHVKEHTRKMKVLEIDPLKQKLPRWIKEMKQLIKQTKTEKDKLQYKEQLKILEEYQKQTTFLEKLFEKTIETINNLEK